MHQIWLNLYPIWNWCSLQNGPREPLWPISSISHHDLAPYRELTVAHVSVVVLLLSILLSPNSLSLSLSLSPTMGHTVANQSGCAGGNPGTMRQETGQLWSEVCSNTVSNILQLKLQGESILLPSSYSLFECLYQSPYSTIGGRMTRNCSNVVHTIRLHKLSIIPCKLFRQSKSGKHPSQHGDGTVWCSCHFKYLGPFTVSVHK